MDIINRINQALGYNHEVAVKAVNKMPLDGVKRNNEYGENVFNSELRFGANQYVVPLRLALESSPDDVFSLPLDPVVSINGSKTVAKRDIAKGNIRGNEVQGTVKELWNNNDWNISVSGVLKTMGEREDESVEYYVEQLLKFLTADEALIVECDTLNSIFGVTKVVVESYDFPFTKGKENQAFTFSLVSDTIVDLELDL